MGSPPPCLQLVMSAARTMGDVYTATRKLQLHGSIGPTPALWVVLVTRVHTIRYFFSLRSVDTVARTRSQSRVSDTTLQWL